MPLATKGTQEISHPFRKASVKEQGLKGVNHIQEKTNIDHNITDHSLFGEGVLI
jgi:hypothetical protein